MNSSVNYKINKWDINSILAIANLPNINTNAAIQKIESSADINHFLKFTDLFKVSSSLTNIELFDSSKSSITDEADEIIEYCESEDINIVCYWDDNYPLLLKKIDFPPLVLYTKGDFAPNSAPIISMVGTRHSTEYGKMVAEKFTEVFANAGVTVCSGMATGIDTISHFSTIKNNGITYAVIASGIDKISPQIAQMNADKIIESGGAIISTYKPGTNALPPYFLQRNRIISGMAVATIVVESAYKGGSLNTARNAFEQHREVYAVPGKINSERSKGTNNLIKKNIANIALSAEDILLDLNLKKEEDISNSSKANNKIELNFEQSLVYNTIDSEPIHIDEIARLTEIEIPQLLSVLLNMEFANLVKQLPGKHYIKLNL